MIELREITEDNFSECIKLEVHEEQKKFVASNVGSLAEAYLALRDGGTPMPYAIYNNDKMVGFVMFIYGAKDEDDKDDEDAYYIWRFMIDKRYQGKGYGKAAMVKVLDLIKTFPHGKANLISLSYEPENTAAKALYGSLGFKETGEKNDDELVSELII
jgi:diamine N-acetyltransferase